jgi:hypothetical protein
MYTAMLNLKSAAVTDAFLNAVPKARIVEGRIKVHQKKLA